MYYTSSKAYGGARKVCKLDVLAKKLYNKTACCIQTHEKNVTESSRVYMGDPELECFGEDVWCVYAHRQKYVSFTVS